MFGSWLSDALFIAIILIAYMNKFFFMKGGMIFKMNGIFPQKIGNREEDSKWALRISHLTIIMILIFVIYTFTLYLQQESDKIQQQIGNLR